MNTARSITEVLIAGLILMASQAANAGIAGNVQFANGNVQLINAAGQSHALRKGDAINESDTVATEKSSSAQIRMRDGGLIAVRPDSRLKFESFAYSGEQDGTEKSFFSLLRGGMRAITGLIGQLHKSNYRINTPTTTIGIRGTDHEIYVVVQGSALAATVPVGTYNKVNAGGTVMTTAAGALNIQPNQMGFAAANNQMPQLQPVNLNIFTITAAPSPQVKGVQNNVRAGAVVDNAAIQGQAYGTQGMTALQANIRAPIKGTFGGVTAPPQTIVF